MEEAEEGGRADFSGERRAAAGDEESASVLVASIGERPDAERGAQCWR